MKEFIRDVIIALAIVIVISLVVKPTIVKEQSMEDTLHSNDFLFLYKLAYINDDHPEPGDIIVFESDLVNNDPQGLPGLINSLTGKTSYKLLIKRVIGVEGDVINIKDGVVYRNGEALDEDYIKEDYTNGFIDNLIVPEDQLFVMGDNRAVSMDSRELGTIAEDRVVGKAVIRVFPFEDFRKL